MNGVNGGSAVPPIRRLQNGTLASPSHSTDPNVAPRTTIISTVIRQRLAFIAPPFVLGRVQSLDSYLICTGLFRAQVGRTV